MAVTSGLPSVRAVHPLAAACAANHENLHNKLSFSLVLVVGIESRIQTLSRCCGQHMCSLELLLQAHGSGSVSKSLNAHLLLPFCFSCAEARRVGQHRLGQRLTLRFFCLNESTCSKKQKKNTASI